MTIAFVASSTVITATAVRGTSTYNVAHPGGSVAAGNLAVISAACRPAANTPTISDPGWTYVANGTGGAGSEVADSGTLKCAKWMKVLDGTESGTVTITNTSGTMLHAVMDVYSKTGAGGWFAQHFTAPDNSSGANFAGTTGSPAQPVAAGDLLHVSYAANTDATSGITTQLATQTGTVFAARSARSRLGNSDGNDGTIYTYDCLVTSASPGTGAIGVGATWAATSAGPHGVSVFKELAQVVASTDLRWIASNLVTGSADLRWNVSNTVTSSLDLRWGVASAVSSPIDLRWKISTAVTASLDLRWISLASVTASSDLRWSVRAIVSGSTDLRWAVLGAVTASSDLRWRSFVGVTNSVDLRWIAAGSVTGSLDLHWRVSSVVSLPTDLRWRVATSVTSSADLRWGVRSVVSAAADLRWTVAGSVSGSIDVRWSVRGAVSGTLDVRWAVRSQINGPLELRWASGGFVPTEIDLRWAVQGVASALRPDAVAAYLTSHVQSHPRYLGIRSPQSRTVAYPVEE